MKYAKHRLGGIMSILLIKTNDWAMHKEKVWLIVYLPNILLCMAQSFVFINKINIIPPNLCLAYFIYILLLS